VTSTSPSPPTRGQRCDGHRGDCRIGKHRY
jgi:hypothetical protein